MTFTIRPLQPADYEAMAVIYRAAMPGSDDTAESLQDDDEHTHAVERWVAEVDGHVVGTASWFQLANRLHPQKFWMDGAVHPDYQHKGIGGALFARVLEAIAPRNPLSLRTFSREDYADTRRFVEQHGFAEAKRTWESFLDLTHFDFAPYEGQPEHVEATGIRLVTLPELQGTPGWEQRLLDLYNAIQTDVPDIDQAAAVAMEYFAKNYLGSGTFSADGHFIALDGDRWVGMSTLWKTGVAGRMDTGLTGVLPEYRRRGIALAAKLRSLAWARAQGVASVRTTNASTNRGMLAINEKLGFARRPAWLHLVRTF